MLDDYPNYLKHMYVLRINSKTWVIGETQMTGMFLYFELKNGKIISQRMRRIKESGTGIYYMAKFGNNFYVTGADHILNKLYLL